MRKILILFFVPILLLSQNWKEDFNKGVKFENIVKGNENYLQNLYERSSRLKRDSTTKGKLYDPYKKAAKQYGRWRNYWKNRLDKEGNYVPSIDGYNSFNKFRRERNTRDMSSKDWTFLGPKNIPKGNFLGYPGMGRVNIIRFHPTDENIIWVGAATGGLWKSEDKGNSWKSMSAEFSNLGISDIVISKNDPNIMFIATGDFNGLQIPSSFIFKSDDGGNTWVSLGNINSIYYISKLLIDTNNIDNIFMGINYSAYKFDLTRITEITEFIGYGIKSICYSNDNNEIYAGSKLRGSFLKSTDNGNTWTRKTIKTTSESSVIVKPHPTNNNIIYCAVENSGGNTIYIYKSLDKGSTWSNISILNNVNTQGGYNFTFDISPTNPNYMVVGAVEGWRSKDGGVNWGHYLYGYPTTQNQNYVHCDHHSFQFNPYDGLLYNGNDGGVFRGDITKDNQWEDISEGLYITQYYNFDVSKNKTKVILAGAQDNDFSSSEIGNNTKWKGIAGGDGIATVIDPYDNNIQYGGSQNGILQKTVNGWASSRRVRQIENLTEFVWPLIIDPKDNNIFYAGGKEYLYKSTDRCDNFKSIGPKLSNEITSIAVAPSNSNYIYFCSGKKIYSSTDRGNTWISNTIGNVAVDVHYVAVSDKNPNIIYATYKGYIGGEKVFKSEDGGRTWDNISLNLPNIPINCISLVSGTNEDLYIGTDYGVFYKNNSMNEWKRYGDRLPFVIVNDIKPHYQTGKIVVATFGRGIWEVDWNDGELGGDNTSNNIGDIKISDAIRYNTVIKQDKKLTIEAKEDLKVSSIILYNMIGGAFYQKIDNPNMSKGERRSIGIYGIFNSGNYILKVVLSTGKSYTKRIMVL